MRREHHRATSNGEGFTCLPILFALVGSGSVLCSGVVTLLCAGVLWATVDEDTSRTSRAAAAPAMDEVVERAPVDERPMLVAIDEE